MKCKKMLLGEECGGEVIQVCSKALEQRLISINDQLGTIRAEINNSNYGKAKNLLEDLSNEIGYDKIDGIIEGLKDIQ